MKKTLSVTAGMAVLFIMIMVSQAILAQENTPNTEPATASGTLNIVIANQNGFVIAADSRMSSDNQFQCEGHMRLYCDNSQKLFRTTQNSALVIAGFAVDRRQSPLDLAIAPVLLKQFGPRGLAQDDRAAAVPGLIEGKISQALTDVASLSYPFDPQNFNPRTLLVTFARLQANSIPVLRRVLFIEKLELNPTLQVYVPKFEIKDSGEQQIVKFTRLAFGLPYVAYAIFDGQWRSEDPDILNYYERQKHGQLDAMPLIEMRKLAVAILKASKQFLPRVGGEDQIGVFPANGDPVAFSLPANLPRDAQSVPSVLTWVGLNCSKITCEGPVSVTLDATRARGSYKKFFFASRFGNTPIALEDNIFVGNDFNGVTFKWTGGTPFMLQNTVNHCILEVRESLHPPDIPDLRGCQIVRKPLVDFPEGTVGLPGAFNVAGGVFIQPEP